MSVSQTKSLSLAQGGENSRQFGANSEQVAQLGHGRVATLPCHLYLHTVLMYVTKVMFSHGVGRKPEQTEIAGNSTDRNELSELPSYGNKAPCQQYSPPNPTNFSDGCKTHNALYKQRSKHNSIQCMTMFNIKSLSSDDSL